MTEVPLVPSLNSYYDVSAKSAEASVQIIERFLSLVHRPSEIVLVEHDVGFTAGTNKAVVRLQPTNAFLDALAALGTCNIDLGIVEINHGSSSPEPNR